ncbi:MAG: hypothetical protein LR011_12490 [Verrucomicrobia bacterium]|nr:hypothetical protein [Verrucomicrobiota bacterium]
MKHKKLNYLFAVIFACGLAGQSAHAQPIAFESLTTELIKRADMDLPDGSTQQIDGGWLISSSGTDATYDPFGDHATFLYEEITGDFDRAVQIVSFDTLDPDGRGGIMVRESLDSISRVAKIAVSGLTGAEDESGVPIGRDRIEVMVRRDPRNLDEVDAPLGYSRLGRAYPGVGEAIPNLWIRVARHGNHFNYYLSENGSSWKLIGEDYFIGLPAKLFVGTYATTTTLESNVATVEFAGYRNSAVSDGVGPVAVSAGTLDKKVIGILFNEALASASVVPGNFAVTGATVAGARLGLGGESVYLDVTGLTADAFTVTINGVTDAGGNAISSNFNVSGTATAGWSAVDIGVFNEPENRPQDGDDPAIIGQTVAVSSGDHLTLEIVGGGSNIWNPGDFGHFVHKEQTGDFDIQVKVERFSNSYKTSTFGHSGLWIRNSLYNEDQENTPEGTAVVNYGNLTYGEGNVERTALAIWRDEAGGGYGNGDVIGTSTADDNGVTGRWGHLRVANAKGDFVEGSSSSASRWLRLNGRQYPRPPCGPMMV